MKKLIQSIICYKKVIVTDLETKRKEQATYIKIFGIVVKTIYEPLLEQK